MKIEVRTPNEDWGCALYKGAHYTPKNTAYAHMRTASHSLITLARKESKTRWEQTSNNLHAKSDSAPKQDHKKQNLVNSTLSITTIHNYCDWIGTAKFRYHSNIGLSNPFSIPWWASFIHSVSYACRTFNIGGILDIWPCHLIFGCHRH